MKKKLFLSLLFASAMLSVVCAHAFEPEIPESTKELVPVETAVQSLSTEWRDSDVYGNLLWGYDFDTATTTSSLAPDYCPDDSYALYKNPNARFDNSSIVWGWSSAVTVAIDNARFRINNPTYGFLQFSILTPTNYGEGRYTLEYDFTPFQGGSTYVKVATDAGELQSDSFSAGGYETGHVTYSFTIDGSTATKINYIYIYAPDASNTVMFFDNIKLYKASVDKVSVTLNYNGSSLDGKSTANVSLAKGEALPNPGYCFDHWENASGDTVTTVSESETTLYAVWKDDPTLGTMITTFDFTGTSSFDHLRPDYQNDAYDYYDEQSWQNYSALCRYDGTGGFDNGAVTLTGYGTNQPALLLSMSPIWTTEGTYTVEYEFKGVPGTHIRFVTDAGDITTASTSSSGDGYTKASFTVSVGGDSGNAQLKYIYIYAEDASAKAYFDNIRVYIKEPSTADVTFDYNGKSYNDVTLETVKMKVGDTLPNISVYPYYLARWKNSSGQTVTKVPEENITVTAEWEEYREYGKLRLVYDFNNTLGAYKQQPSYIDGLSMATNDNSSLWWDNVSYIAVENGAYRLDGMGLPGLRFQFSENITETGTYTVSFKVKGSETSFVRFKVLDSDGKQTDVDVHRESKTDEYTSLAASITLGSDYKALVGFGVYSNTSGARFYVDDIKLYEFERTAPEMLSVTSIRTTASDGYSGIRFAAFTDEKLRAQADEYGFIATLSENVMGDEEYLVFNANGDRNTRDYVSGIAYSKDGETDKVYSNTADIFGGGENDFGEGYYYTCVLIGIPLGHYEDEFMVRPYIRIGGKTFYGASVTDSLYDVAERIADGGYNGLTDSAKKVVNNILAGKALNAE